MDPLIIPPDGKPAPAPPRDPAKIGYPPMLAIELALGEYTPREVCEAWGIDETRWNELRTNDLFVADVNARVIELNTEGVSFKMKARLQAEAYLKEMWKIAHNPNVAENVRADIMKFTVRAAGLDGSKDQAAAAQGAAIGAALQINLHLG